MNLEPPSQKQTIKSRREDLEKRLEKLKLQHKRDKMLLDHEFELLYLDCGHPNLKHGTDISGVGESWCNDCGWQD